MEFQPLQVIQCQKTMMGAKLCRNGGLKVMESGIGSFFLVLGGVGDDARARLFDVIRAHQHNNDKKNKFRQLFFWGVWA